MGRTIKRNGRRSVLRGGNRVKYRSQPLDVLCQFQLSVLREPSLLDNVSRIELQQSKLSAATRREYAPLAIRRQSKPKAGRSKRLGSYRTAKSYRGCVHRST